MILSHVDYDLYKSENIAYLFLYHQPQYRAYAVFFLNAMDLMSLFIWISVPSIIVLGRNTNGIHNCGPSHITHNKVFHQLFIKTTENQSQSQSLQSTPHGVSLLRAKHQLTLVNWTILGKRRSSSSHFEYWEWWLILSSSPRRTRLNVYYVGSLRKRYEIQNTDNCAFYFDKL